VIAAAAALFVVSLGYGVIVPLLPALAGGRAAAAPATLSLVYSVYAAAKIGAQVPGGVWVDRAGARRVLNLALLAFTVSLAGFLPSSNLHWFAVVRAVEGIATGLAYPAVFALVLIGAPEGQTGRRIGLTVGIGTSGLLVGPALGGLLAPFGARVPVIVALAAAATVTVAGWLAPSASAPPPAPRTLTRELRTIASLAADVGFVAMMLPIAFNKLTFSAFQALLPLCGPDWLGVGQRGVSFLFALTGVCFALAQPVGGWLVDRFDARRVALAFTVPLLIALAAMSLRAGFSQFTVAYAGYVLFSSLIFTATMKHAARAYGTDDTYGGIFGVLATLTDLMTIVGPLIFLNLYATRGLTVFLFMALAGVPFAIGFLFLGRRR
jgi:MFS family permease